MFIGGAAPTFLICYLILDPERATFFFSSQVGILTLTMVLALEAIGIFWLWSIIRMDF